MQKRCNSGFSQELYNNTLEPSTKRLFFKVILLGDLHVGKTAISNMFLKGFLKDKSMCKIMTDYNSKEIQINNVRVEIQLWDTCGQEEYKSLTKQYFRDVKGILLVYDMTDQQTFINLNKWLEEIYKNIPNKTPIIIVANKKDLLGQRKVSEIEGRCYAEKNNYQYIETSCVTLLNIKEAFKELGLLMLKNSNLDYGIENKGKEIAQNNQKPKKKKKDILRENFEKIDQKNKKKVNCC